MAKRLLMDSNVVDWLADTPGARELMAAALQREAFSPIEMHIIRAQLAAAPDPARRTLLLETYDSLPKQPVVSHGFVMGTSALGRATLGDGKETGISIDEVKPGGRGAVQDALIATTASGEADVLVTNDEGLQKKVRRSRAQCVVWTTDELNAHLLSATTQKRGGT
jgi:hypothetical protein